MPRDQHAACMFAASNRGHKRVIRGLVRNERDVPDTLVRALGVVVLDVLPDEPTQMTLAKRDHAREQLTPDAANEAHDSIW